MIPGSSMVIQLSSFADVWFSHNAVLGPVLHKASAAAQGTASQDACVVWNLSSVEASYKDMHCSPIL